MDLCQSAIAEVPVTFREGHAHRVGIERQPEHSSLLQKTPHDATPSPASHEPLQVTVLNLFRESLFGLSLGLSSFLTAKVGRIVTAHSVNVCGVRFVTGINRKADNSAGSCAHSGESAGGSSTAARLCYTKMREA